MVDINVMGCDLAAKNLKDHPLFITEIKGESYFYSTRKDFSMKLIDTRILRVSYFDELFVKKGLLLVRGPYLLLILIFNIWLEAN